MAPLINGSGSTSPETMSVAGDRDTVTSYTVDDTASVLSMPRLSVPYNTPAHTVAGSTVPDISYIREHAPEIDAARLHTVQHSSPVVSDARNPDSSFEVASNASTEVTEHHHEHSTWESEAVEMMENALARLAVLARDEHLNNPAKSVQEYYSERLSKIIKAGEINFDVNKLLQ